MKDLEMYKEAERLERQEDERWEDGQEDEIGGYIPASPKKKAYVKDYEDICHELGFRPECGFVKITTRNTISFTLGKPDEIRKLYKAVIDHGYIPAKDLVERIETL